MKKQKTNKRKEKIFYEDKCVSDISLLYFTSNYEGIKVVFENDKTRLMNGMIFLAYKIYIPHSIDENEILNHISNVISSINKIIYTLRITLPIDVFLFDSAEVENGKLKLYLVFRVKVVNPVNYVYRPIPDNIILTRYYSTIEKTITSIVNKQLGSQYSVSKIKLLELKSKQLRTIGFPPRKSYIILDNVRNIEDYVSDDTISFITSYMTKDIVNTHSPQNQNLIAKEINLNKPINVSPHTITKPPDLNIPKEQEIVQPIGRPLDLDLQKSDEVSTPIVVPPKPIPEPHPTIESQPIIPKEDSEKGSQLMQQMSSMPEVSTSQNPVTPQVLEPTPQLNSFTENAFIQHVSEVTQVESTPEVNEFGYVLFKEDNRMVTTKYIDLLFNVNVNNSRELYESLYYGSLDNVTNKLFGIDDIVEYDLISSSRYNKEVLDIINGRPFNRGTFVKFLPIGVTSWGEKFYLPVEFCENPQQKVGWQATTNRVITIVGKMGSGKTHMGTTILELNALAGGSSILLITASNEVKAYYTLKQLLNKVRPYATQGRCVELSDQRERNLCELLVKLGAENLNIQLATISSLKDSIPGVKFDILMTIPANELNYGLIRHLATGTSSKDFANLSRAFKIGIIGLYEYMLNFFMRNNFTKGFDDFTMGGDVEADPDGDDKVGSIYKFFLFLKSANIITDNTNPLMGTVLSRMDPDTRKAFDKVQSQFLSISSQYKSILQMFKGITYPILEDIDDPVISDTNVTKDFVFRNFFKPYTLTIIYMPMEKGEIYSKVGIVLFKVLLEIFANAMAEFREMQTKANETFYPILLGVDEAHLYFKKTLVQDVVGRVEEILEKVRMISKLSRKYSFGLILMSQNITDIPIDVFKNSGVRMYGIIDDIRELRNVTDNPKLMTFFKQNMRKRWFIVHDDMIKGGYVPVMSTRRLLNILDENPYRKPSIEIYNTIKFSGIYDLYDDQRFVNIIEKYKQKAEQDEVPEICYIRT